MRTVLYIAGKDLLLRWRDRLGFFWWMLGFPLLISILIGSIFAGALGGPRRSELAIVDAARSPESRDYIEAIGRTGNIKVSEMDEAQAVEAVKLRKVAAFVRIQPGFHISPAIFFGYKLPLEASYDPSRIGDWTYLQAMLNTSAAEYLRERWVDPSRRDALIQRWLLDLGQNPALVPLAAATVEGALGTMNRYLGIVSAGSQPSSAPATKLSMVSITPLKGGIRPKSSFEICFPIGIIWGLLGLSAEFAIGFVQERTSGTLLRLRVAPFSRLQILAGNGLACFVACIGVILMLLAVGHVGFGVRIQSPGPLVVGIICIALCSVGLTMMLSVIGKTESAVGGGSWAVLLIFGMLGGGMVPQMFMPNWMTIASNVSPVKWAILTLEGGIWRNFSWHDVVRPCLVLVGEGIVFASIGLAILFRTER